MYELAAVTAVYSALFVDEAASIRMICAFGAMACAHSMSSDSSPFHPFLHPFAGLRPVAYSTAKFGAGSPNSLEKVARSAAALG
jgi:hypothetical protein